jgi:hypothetical protein
MIWRMRCFHTPDGSVLVEWALSDTTVLKPNGTPLGQAGTFYLLDSAGAVMRSWTTTTSAVQETFATTAHVIEGDALVDYYHGVDWGHEDHPSLDRSVALGLTPLAPGDAPSETEVRRAIERDEAARSDAHAEHDRVESERLAGFERALPPLGADERITLVWRYAGDEIVIGRSTGEELWREADWPWMGKDLYRRLSRVAAQKYGERLAGFEVDVPADAYLRFDND